MTAPGELLSKAFWAQRKLMLQREEITTDQVWADLRELHEFVRFHACTFDFGVLRDATFLPFETEWNRKATLMIDWIEATNGVHFDKRPDWPALVKQWELSGMMPPQQ